MSTDPRYDAEKRVRAREFYEGDDTRTVRDVAEHLEISVSRAHTLLVESGAELRPQGRPPKEVDDATQA